MSERTLTDTDLDTLADDSGAAVALVRQQALRSVSLDDVIFPPTFAGDGYQKTGYAIDELSDGTLCALIDSVGSQANRMEALFVESKDGPLAMLVPQIGVAIERKSDDGEKVKQIVSVMEAGHRLGDALIRASELADESRAAFQALQSRNDAGLIARLSPTTLVFGAWDSRDTQAKLPRIVQSVVRAWSVDVLKRSAQYVPPLDYGKFDVFEGEELEAAESSAAGGAPTKNPLAVRGYVPVPATDSHGGVRVNGSILRDVVVNLIALRRLRTDGEGELRRYVLGLSVAAAASDLDGYYRQGCLLTPDKYRDAPWELVHRDGSREAVSISLDTVRDFTIKHARAFIDDSNKMRTVAFDRKRAQVDKNVETGKKKASKKAASKKAGSAT